MDIIKSTKTTDYQTFKRRFKDKKAGTDLDALVVWKNLTGNNLYKKKKSLELIEKEKIKVSDLNNLKEMVKSSIIVKETE